MLHKYIMNSSDVDALGLPSHWNTDFVACVSRLSMWADGALPASNICALSYLLAGERIPVTENKAFPATNRNGPLISKCY